MYIKNEWVKHSINSITIIFLMFNGFHVCYELVISVISGVCVTVK